VRHQAVGQRPGGTQPRSPVGSSWANSSGVRLKEACAPHGTHGSGPKGAKLDSPGRSPGTASMTTIASPNGARLERPGAVRAIVALPLRPVGAYD
jgi:hypothetical protein